MGKKIVKKEDIKKEEIKVEEVKIEIKPIDHMAQHWAEHNS
tara:strand:- start:267 stop:389 length:123 start_codon:yes stop_codon:yes gene_type:complete